MQAHSSAGGRLAKHWLHSWLVNICRLCADRHEKWWTVEDAALVHDVPQAVLILLAGSNTEMLYAGVLNTDNMSILGLTIDYGPYGFMDRYMAMP